MKSVIIRNTKFCAFTKKGMILLKFKTVVKTVSFLDLKILLCEKKKMFLNKFLNLH